MAGETQRVVGLMSGTSMDGIDAAVIDTDGTRVTWHGPARTVPYDDDLRARVVAALEAPDDTHKVLEADLTDANAAAVEGLLAAHPEIGQVDLVGYHGQTIVHRPEQAMTRQLGDGVRLAARLGIDVVDRFRHGDMVAGGQGAPLASLYHQALAADLARPLVVLNMGGVGNATWLGAGDAILAFDTGPANAPTDDWVAAHGRGLFDEGGALAAAGTADLARVTAWMRNPYFDLAPPKSLDRGDFGTLTVGEMSLEDGAATLTAFSAYSAAAAARHFPAPARRWLVTGGGRHNPTLMAMIGDQVGVPVEPVEAVRWRGDALEAEAFAFLALRCVRGLPLTVPGTTGCAAPTLGGVFHRSPTFTTR